jgi:hypothetical protein
MNHSLSLSVFRISGSQSLNCLSSLTSFAIRLGYVIVTGLLAGLKLRYDKWQKNKTCFVVA